MKPLLDVVLALFWLAVSATVAISTILLVWLQGYHLQFYIAPRVGRDGRVFRMAELGSTTVHADRSGVDSTSVNGRRNTPVGHFVRRYKLDELTEFWNVLTGDMSLVGPRPNVKRETDLYSCEEKKLSKVQSGITDFSSIVFSDERDILEDKSDPDLAYNEQIRPWKSRLGIFYVERRSLLLDIWLIFLTVVAIVDRKAALSRVEALLRKMGADETLVRVSRRMEPLVPHPPPGMSEIVTSRAAASLT